MARPRSLLCLLAGLSGPSGGFRRLPRTRFGSPAYVPRKQVALGQGHYLVFWDAPMLSKLREELNRRTSGAELQFVLVTAASGAGRTQALKGLAAEANPTGGYVELS